MAISLMYHDVVPAGQFEASGFGGAGAARYKLTVEEFRDHIDAIANAIGSQGFEACRLESGSAAVPSQSITFDDGGASAFGEIADRLEARGWRGHFFITTDYIGRSGFVTEQQISELSRRGHLIGSHSCSHPTRMSLCGDEQLRREWSESMSKLGDILGAPIWAASVPGGFYSRRVAQSAAASGLKLLFTSEPTTRMKVVDGCLVLGRYAIYRGTTAATAAGLARGDLAPRLRQAIAWNGKKAAKMLGGRAYLWLRDRLLPRPDAASAVVNPRQ